MKNKIWISLAAAALLGVTVLPTAAEIGFMGWEASIYTYSGGAADAPVNFAQLTQRVGNFLVAREKMPEFSWKDLMGRKCLAAEKMAYI